MRPAPPAPPLSAQLQAAAETLAAQVNEGDFAGAAPDSVTELRGLSMMLAMWSDRALTDEGEAAELRRALEQRPRETGLAGHLRRVAQLLGRG